MFPGRNAYRSALRAAAFASRYIRALFETGRFVPPGSPAASIETTNICNAKCVFCANTVMQRKKEPLDMALFEKAVDQVAAMGATEIDFNVTIGDPLLDPHLLKRANYTKRYPQFKGLGFVTTLQWLHRWPLEDFFAAGFTWLSISISLSGREKYLEFFGVDKYDQALNNLLTLIHENERRTHPIHLHIGIKPTNEPVESVLEHPDFKQVNALVEQDLISELRAGQPYVDDWIGSVKLPSYLKLRPLVPRAFRPCRLLYKGLMIYSNGNVGACSCRDFEANSELVLGNLQETPLREMWEGPKLAQLRSDWRLKNAVPEICQSCRHYLY